MARRRSEPKPAFSLGGGGVIVDHSDPEPDPGPEVDNDTPLTRADLRGVLAEMLDERAGGDSTEATEPPASKPETRRRLPAGFTPGRGKADPKPDITGMSPKELAAMDEKALDALSNEQRVERFDTLAKQGH